jgi:hypothetical protein
MYKCSACGWEGPEAPFDCDKANLILDDYWKLMGGSFPKSYDLLVKKGNQDLRNYNFSLMIIKYSLLVDVKGKSEGIIQLIATRLAFSAASAFTLALNGYYHNSMMIIRDIMEIGFLLDYFTYKPELILDWATCDDKKRKKEYQASELYKKLTGLENTHNNARKFIYSEYSRIFTHTSPNFAFFITKNGERITDPIICDDQLEFCIWELSLWTEFAMVSYLSNLYPKTNRPPNSQVDKLIEHLKEYMFEVETASKKS